MQYGSEECRTAMSHRHFSCGDAKMKLFDYIEVFYNQRRRHSTIGYVSPAAFERAAAQRESVMRVHTSLFIDPQRFAVL